MRILTTAAAALLLLADSANLAGAARPQEQRRAQADPMIVLPPGNADGQSPPKDLGEKTFTLRHIYHHGGGRFPGLHRHKDIPADAELQVTSDFGETFEPAPKLLRARASSTCIQRLKNRTPAAIDHLLEHARIHGEAATLLGSAWTTDVISGPNISDKETVITFAKMASNAYAETPDDASWKDVKGGFNYTDDFGWQADGLRGHIFADERNQTIVIGLKGTSPAVFDGIDTTGNDKLNDNLFGSCCCAQGGDWGWKQVCDCMTGAFTCNNTCLVKNLQERNHYYWAVRDLYHNVTERYPHSDVWLSGHSLGGVVSALLGLTYGLPTLTFEAFPDAMAAKRLGLPTPPGYGVGSHQSRTDVGIYHFGHTADPIYMGQCNGASSFCTIGGYAFEGVCHTGKTCIYDTVKDLGWRVGIGTHRITYVLNSVLQKYDTVPTCQEDLECHDCFKWKYFESNGTDTTTSSSTSTKTVTRTRTETCKTPGWWGCLDESTTTGATTTSTSSSTLSTSTSTCKTPGWFGCKDSTTAALSSSKTSVSTPSAAPAPILTTTTVVTTSITSSSSRPSNTCETPGWFGCNDPTTRPTTSTTAAPSPSLPTSRPTATPNSSAITHRVCAEHHWYGPCKYWQLGPKDDL